MSGHALFERACAAGLATLLFWLPIVPGAARAQEWAAREERIADFDDPRVVEAVLQTGEEGEPLRLGDRERYHDRLLQELRDLQEQVLPPTSSGRDQAAEDEVDPSPQLEPLTLPTGPAKTAVTPQQVVLPRGEGSIEGMGESFTPNLSSGTGTFSVPIALPSGRAGVQPSLALSYATSAGNDLAGIGWSLAVPFVSRQTDKGLPAYLDGATWHGQEDVFMYNGGQELVPVSSEVATSIDGGPVPAELAGWQQYRARVEGAFMRFFRAPDSTRWVVQAKDGTRFDFGACPPAESQSCEAATQADPEDPSRVFSWPLVRMSDAHGSTVQYRYRADGGALYPLSIYYTTPAHCAAYQDPRAARACFVSPDEYAHRVAFAYEARPDVTSSFVTTWRVERGLRLKRIDITSAQDQVGARSLVRRYRLSYHANNYHSLLAAVQVEGRPSHVNQFGAAIGNVGVLETSLADEVVGDLLPPMRFEYSRANATTAEIAGFGGIDATVQVSAASPEHSVDEGRVDLFDVNADGLPDLLVTDPARYAGGAGVFFNGFSAVGFRAGSFSPGQRVDVPSGLSAVLSLSSVNILPMDVDGDGRADLLHMPREANYGYFGLSKSPSEAGNAYDPLSGWSFYHVTDLLPEGVTDPRIDLGKDGLAIKTLDVNNDHLIDIVRTTGTTIQTWLNLGRYPSGDGRFGSATWRGGEWSLSTAPVESCLPFAGQNLDFADPAVRIADMNGDGLQDIVRLAPDAVLWWPGRGAGAWGAGPHACDGQTRAGREIQMANPPAELNVELASAHLVDANEDGAADLVQVGFDHVSVWFNQGGDAFTERLLAEDTPFAVDALDRVRIADIDGSTTSDVVYAEGGNWRWIDFMGGIKPRLLTQVDNGLGGLTTLEYGSSVDDYLRDVAESQSCDAAAHDCFTWHREPLLPNESDAGCDEKVRAHSGACVHRVQSSPVLSSVVRRVRSTDRLDVLGVEANVNETEYRYHDAYYEGIEQEFRGFGAAEAIAVGDEYEPTSTTRTYFHQGRRPNQLSGDRLADNPNEALKGREYLTEVYDAGGKHLKASHATYVVRKLMLGLSERAVSYAYVKSTDELRYDTSVAEQREAGSTSFASVLREEARVGQGLVAVQASPGQPGDASHEVQVRDSHFVRLRTTVDVVDNAGHMRQQTVWGRSGRGEFSEAVADERVVSQAVPTRVPGTLCDNTGWLWRTAQTWTSDLNPATRLGDAQMYYSPCGDLLTTTRIANLPASGAFEFQGDGSASAYTQANDYEASSSQVDAWGQPLVQCGGGILGDPSVPCLSLANLVYDEEYEQLVTHESVAVDGTGAATRFLTHDGTWDRGLGLLTATTDPNGYLSEATYDGLGRVTSATLPSVKGCEGTRVPTTRIVYDLTDAPSTRPLSRVTTTTLLSCGSYGAPDSQILAHAYVDGMGRVRAALSEGESDSTAWEDGRAHPFTKSGRQIFTKKGQARLSYQTDYFDGAPDDYAAVIARPNVPYTRALYDAFGRPTLSINEDGTYKSISYHALSRDLCDEIDNGFSAPGAPDYLGTCTTERSDGHGRVIDQQLRQVTLDGVRENHRLFTYYRADGAVTRVVRGLTGSNVLRPESTFTFPYVERRFHYDSLGRRLASEDPDTDNRAESALSRRTWRYLFNRSGDLVAVRDPRGCGQNFYYDLAGRLVGETYVQCAEAQGESSRAPACRLEASPWVARPHQRMSMPATTLTTIRPGLRVLCPAVRPLSWVAPRGSKTARNARCRRMTNAAAWCGARSSWP